MRLAFVLLSTAALASAAGWKPLFNGKDADGWKHVGPGRFVIEDGQLTTDGGMGLLWYEREKLGNCTIRVVYKVTGEHDNSGVYIRMAEPPRDPWYGVHNGYEVQIDGAGDEWHSSGALYSLSKVTERRQKSGAWNVMEITLRGQTTLVKLNGKVVNRFQGNQPVPPRQRWYEPVRGPRPDSGYIGLQNHDEKSHVVFKEISVKR